MPERQHFVILSLPRTGSTYLVDFLDAVPGIRCLAEIFHRNKVLLRHHQPADPELTDKDVRDRDALGFLQRLEQDVGACDGFGIKFFPAHGEQLLRYFCASRHWKKIFLWRENLLEQYVSYLLAAEQFGSESWGRVADAARVAVPLGPLVDDLHDIERRYIQIEEALVLAAHEDVFALEYDDLGRDEMMQALLAFLGMSAAPPHRGDIFARGPRAPERIANYAEVSAVLRQTRYSRWIAA